MISYLKLCFSLLCVISVGVIAGIIAFAMFILTMMLVIAKALFVTAVVIFIAIVAAFS